MMNGSHIDDWALNAYVDGQISAGQKAEIEAQLARDPAMAARVASWRRQRDLLKAEYDGVLAEPMPPEIKATLNGGSGRRWRPALAAAAALLFILGGLGGWFLKGQSGPDLAAGLGQQALAAHMVFSSEKRHPVEVLAHEKDHLAMWLGKRLGTPFKVPDLTAEGYTFLGGRLLALLLLRRRIGDVGAAEAHGGAPVGRGWAGTVAPGCASIRPETRTPA